MISFLAVGLAVILSHVLLDGSRLDQGLQVTVMAPATLAIAVGLGLLVRARGSLLVWCAALAVLVPLRGLLVGWAEAVSPGESSPLLASILSLGPVGFVLGRVLCDVTRSRGLPLAAGWVAGELAVVAGVVSYLPALLAGLVAGAALAGLGRARSKPSDAGEDEAPHATARRAWEALPFGFALGVVWIVLRRVVPGYSTPPVHSGSEVALALLVPAILVGWPASVLASGSAGRRVLRAVGFLAIGYAVWKLAGSLDLNSFSSNYVAVQTEIRQTASRWGAPVTEWRGWLLMYCGLPAAGFGVLMGCLGRSARAPFVLGLGVALASESWLIEHPSYGPQELLVAAAGVAAVAALSGWNRWALWLAPAGLAAAAFIPEDQLAGYERIRRLGEPAVESQGRQLPADVLVYSSGGPDITALQARRTYWTTFTDRVPLGEVLELRGEPWAAEHSHGTESEEPLPIPLIAPLDDDEPTDEMQRHFGIRFAGVPAHPGHDPMGAEGTLGRLLRLFGVPGRVFVTGIGAEFVGADLLDADIATAVDVSSPLPMGLRNQRVLFAQIGSAGLGLQVGDDPLREVEVAVDGSYSMVVIAPERAEWPGSGIVSTEDFLTRAAELLEPGGRCLLWLDTASLDARALRARIASFGRAFGDDCAAFLEMRELTPPLVLLLGWVDGSGKPQAGELQARLPGPDETGLRTRMWGLEDLGAMLILDGEAIAGLADSAAAHRRSAPRPPSGLTATGWGAIQGLLGGTRHLEAVVAGGPATAHELDEVVAGLAVHGAYDYDLGPLGGAMLVEVVDDVDWDAFDREVACYMRAAEADPENPLVQQALAGLLGPLARFGDATRFAEVFEATGAGAMKSWRLAALEAHVRRAGLQEREADEALERARRWAPWAEAHHDH